MNFTVVHCDNHLLVVHKEPGVVVQGASRNEVSLLLAAKKWLKEKYDKKGNVFLAVVHRLDKPVSGLVLFARTSKSASRMSDQFRRGVVQKGYVAVVEGVLPKQTAELSHYLTTRDGRPVITNEHDPTAKIARLRYSLSKQAARMTEVSIELLTGRKHQIRLQLSSLGNPIVGDKRYGAKFELAAEPKRIALLAHKLRCIHPTTKEELNFLTQRPSWWPLTP